MAHAPDQHRASGHDYASQQQSDERHGLREDGLTALTNESRNFSITALWDGCTAGRVLTPLAQHTLEEVRATFGLAKSTAVTTMSRNVNSAPSRASGIVSGSYVIITPVRNEEAYIRETINSVGGQTVLPAEWVVIDDGSSDRTWSILQEAASRYAWLRPVKRPDRGFRYSGRGVVEAFYDGLAHLTHSEWDFLVKLDGDLSFEPTYFCNCLQKFKVDQELGIGGGLICALIDGVLVPESRLDPAFHVRGATKIYRRACWEAIGGLLRSPGWDGIDEVKANMLGWRTATFGDVKVRHYRPAGLATGRWQDWVKGGRGNYMAGYHPVFMLAKALRRVFLRPYGLATVGLLAGFIGSYVKREPRITDERTVKYLRQQQVNRLLGRASIWCK